MQRESKPLYKKQKPIKQQTKSNFRTRKPRQPPSRRRFNTNKGVHSIVLEKPTSQQPRVNEGRESVKEKAIMAYAASGPDVRNPRDSSGDNRGDALQGQVGKVSTEYLLSDDAIRAVCTATISHAQVAGWQASLDITKQNYPYWAANYIYNVLYSAASGNADTLPKVLPVWLRDVCAAIFPKEDRRLPSGSASFKWTLAQNNNGIPSVFNYPQNGGQGQFFFGVDTNVLTDGFPQMTPSIVGNATQMQAAYTSLTNYFESSANLTRNEQNMWKLVSSILTESKLATDVSAFAQSTPVLGIGVGQNAFYDELRSILHIRCPKLSVFNGSKTNSANDPALHVKVSSGDANYLVPSILMQDTTAGYYNAAVPKFKFIDFHEICDVVLRWLCAATSYMYKNTTSHDNLPPNCGLTMNQFQLLLRAMMIGMYPQQHAGQTIYPVDGVSNTNNGGKIFIPFLVSTATVNGLSFPTVILPLALVENLRCLKLAKDFQYYNPVNGKATMKHATYYIPVVGVYKDVVLNWKDYLYSDGNNAVPILTGQGGNISVVDGNNGGTFINIADSSRLTELVTIFNEYVTIIAPCTQSPTQLAFDDPADALRVIAQDNIIDVRINPNYSEKQLDKWASGYQYPKLGATFTKYGMARINQQKFLNALFAIQQQWILPELPLYAGDPVTGYGMITVDKIRLYNTEAWYAPINKQPGLGVRLDLFRFGYIGQLAKAYNASDTTTVKVLSNTEEEGDGGLFSNIVKAFAPVAVSALKYGVTTVASSLIQ